MTDRTYKPFHVLLVDQRDGAYGTFSRHATLVQAESKAATINNWCNANKSNFVATLGKST